MSNKIIKKKYDEDHDIDVIIPAYKAQKTIIRTLSSICEQTIRDRLNVIIVNDGEPDNDYSSFVEMFSPYLDIKEILLPENSGPGVARQKGIEEGNSKYFTCIDADDTFYGAIALETLMKRMEESPVVQCVSGIFLQLSEDPRLFNPHQHDMVWMFGKLYKREFIEKYEIKFNNTRANEDTGYNKWVELLCDNPNEQIYYIELGKVQGNSAPVYCWHNKENSITRINDGQYAHDQCFCGWVDNMIYAITNAKKKRPFGSINQNIAHIMLNLYFYYIETIAKDEVFKDQNWEYVKKFYHTCYKRIEEDISDEVFAQLFSMTATGKWGSGSLLGVLPSMGVKEFMDKLHEEDYDPDYIYTIWDRMWNDPDTKKLMQNNIDCGVCKEGYFRKPTLDEAFNNETFKEAVESLAANVEEIIEDK